MLALLRHLSYKKSVGGRERKRYRDLKECSLMFKVRSVQRDADEEELGEGRQMPGRCVVVPVAEMVLVNSPAVKSQLWFA